MLMGKIVQDITYSLVEYAEACMITTGVFLFSIQQGKLCMIYYNMLSFACDVGSVIVG
jgi:hypothetical protein